MSNGATDDRESIQAWLTDWINELLEIGRGSLADGLFAKRISELERRLDAARKHFVEMDSRIKSLERELETMKGMI